MEILKEFRLKLDNYSPEALRIFLQYLAEKTVLPELYNIVGNKLLELILVFGGTSITIPTLEEVKEKLIDIDIFASLYKLSDSDKQVKVKELQKKYNLPVFDIERRYEDVRKWFESSVIRQLK